MERRGMKGTKDDMNEGYTIGNNGEKSSVYRGQGGRDMLYYGMLSHYIMISKSSHI
jgi:hypothetical protein